MCVNHREDCELDLWGCGCMESAGVVDKELMGGVSIVSRGKGAAFVTPVSPVQRVVLQAV